MTSYTKKACITNPPLTSYTNLTSYFEFPDYLGDFPKIYKYINYTGKNSRRASRAGYFPALPSASAPFPARFARRAPSQFQSASASACVCTCMYMYVMHDGNAFYLTSPLHKINEKSQNAEIRRHISCITGRHLTSYTKKSRITNPPLTSYTNPKSDVLYMGGVGTGRSRKLRVGPSEILAKKSVKTLSLKKPSV